MKVVLINHSESYAICEIIMAYMPREKIEIVDTIPESGNYVISKYTKSEKEFIYETNIYYNEKQYCNKIIRDSFNKTYIKQSFHLIAKDIFDITLPWGVLTGIRPSKIVRELKESGLDDNGARQKLLTHYMTSEKKADLALKVEKKEQALLNNMNNNGVSLYIGIPFCPTRCLYCSFTSQSVKFASTLVKPYLEALLKEIEYTADIIKKSGKEIETVYIGGGTPTSLEAEELFSLIGSLYKNFDLSGIKEFTVEAGRPDTITTEKLQVLKKYNVSRISINPQTMNEKTLKIIGRNHTGDDIRRSYEMALNFGFNHINMDLIAGLPDESVDDFIYTLESIRDMNPKSITVHTMSIKRSSYLAERYDMYNISSANTVNAMLDTASRFMSDDGRQPYYMYRQKNMLGNLENVGYCYPGYECLYNIYIMQEVQSIISVGSGASTKIVNGNHIYRIFNVKEVSEYIKRIDEMLKRKDEIIFKG